PVSPWAGVASARLPGARAAGRALLDQLLLPARTREPDRAGTADKSTPRALGQSKPPQCGPCHANAHCAVIVRDSPAARWPCHVSARPPRVAARIHARLRAITRATWCNHARDWVGRPAPPPRARTAWPSCTTARHAAPSRTPAQPRHAVG